MQTARIPSNIQDAFQNAPPSKPVEKMADYTDPEGRIFYFSIEQNTPEWDAIRHDKITASISKTLLVEQKPSSTEKLYRFNNECITPEDLSSTRQEVVDWMEARPNNLFTEDSIKKGTNQKRSTAINWCVEQGIIEVQVNEKWENEAAEYGDKFRCFGQGAMTLARRKAMAKFTAPKSSQTSVSASAQRGHDLEPHSAAAFQEAAGKKLELVGFISMNDWVGCSPDRLMPAYKHGYETKSFDVDKHAEYLEKPMKLHDEVFHQAQHSMMVTGYPLWVAAHYCPMPGAPALQLVSVEIQRDQEYIDHLYSKIELFIELVLTIRERLAQKMLVTS